MTSTLTIDGFELRGTASNVLALYAATLGWLRILSEEDRSDTVVPVTGFTDDGDRTLQVVRLRRESSIGLTVVDDGTMPSDFYDGIVEQAEYFMKRGMERPAGAEADSSITDTN